MIKKTGIILFSILPLLFFNCANPASVEFGFNDETLLLGAVGEFVISVSKIEAKIEGDYSTIWEGNRTVSVPSGTSDFLSITENTVSIDPGTYRTFKITIDSLKFKQETISTLLIDTNYQFTVNSFSDIIIGGGDELKLVVVIASFNWFDYDSLKIKTGKTPFEGAVVRQVY